MSSILLGFGSIYGMRSNAGIAQTELSGCEIKVDSIPGYRPDPKRLGPVGEFEGNLGNIYLYPLAGVKGLTVSAKTLLAPKAAVKLYDRASKAMRQQSSNPVKAAQNLENAIRLYPDYAEAWNLLGECRVEQNDSTRARDAFKRSVQIDPNYVLPLLSLARLAMLNNQLNPILDSNLLSKESS